MPAFLSFLLHVDTHLESLVRQHGPLPVYAVLFGLIFAETGLVVLPFLPGDSLLFATGALAAKEHALSLPVAFAIFAIAAIAGDSVNFALGKRIGRRLFEKNIAFLNEKNLQRTEEFFDKHGGKTILFARFIPLIRTFAPFVAGSGRMPYGQFVRYNIAAALLWTTLFLAAGYFFGNLPFVRTHFSLVVLMIVAISLVPAAFEAWRARRGPHPRPRP